MKPSNEAPTATGRRRTRTSPQDQRRWAERCHRSRLTPREFAARHGLNPANLQRWRRRFPPQQPAPRLIEVPFPLGPGQPGAWEAELSLIGGVTVRLRGELARETLARLMGDCP